MAALAAAAAFFAAVTTIRTTFFAALPSGFVQIILLSGTSVPDLLRPRPRQHSRGGVLSGKITLLGDPPIPMFAEPPNETALRAPTDPPIARQPLPMNPGRLDHYFHVLHDARALVGRGFEMRCKIS